VSCRRKDAERRHGGRSAPAARTRHRSQATEEEGEDGRPRQAVAKEALKKQVERCAKPAEAGWTKTQVADVVAYVNEAFYPFT